MSDSKSHRAAYTPRSKYSVLNSASPRAARLRRVAATETHKMPIDFKASTKVTTGGEASARGCGEVEATDSTTAGTIVVGGHSGGMTVGVGVLMLGRASTSAPDDSPSDDSPADKKTQLFAALLGDSAWVSKTLCAPWAVNRWKTRPNEIARSSIIFL